MDDLYRRARAGEPAAVARVVAALRPRLTRLAAHYGRRTGENPDDLLQDAWLGLLAALPTLDLGIGAPEQYLLRQARWRLLDALKRARVRRCSQTPLEELEEVPAKDKDIAGVWVGEFVRGLKDTQRTVLECLLTGLTWREAGDVLGCTSANVAYHVRQIRRRYRDWEGV